ncbi:MAG: hypothetical protein ACJAQ6_001800 [Arenicella sp.]|jgi:hypothetical protein
MIDEKNVLLIGWDLEAVDFANWPGLNAVKLHGALNADCEALDALGYQAGQCFIRDQNSAADDVLAALNSKIYSCGLIGAGVRKVEQHFSLFEVLINTVHQATPSAKLCFNTGPTDSVEAVQRWLD